MVFYPYSAVFIDLTFKEYCRLFAKFFAKSDRATLQRILEDSFLKDKTKEKLLACLSVRTGFDLFFQAADMPKGSEIIMTGVNIPDMVSVVTNHGHVAVPLNIDIDKLAPKIEDIEKCITPKTKAIVLSYIFGATFFIEDIIKLAKKHNLYIIEDLAETFTGKEYNGHPEAHVSLFSFGSIKYNTALNGALLVARNDDVLYRKMKHILDQYPMQTVSTYFKKCVKIIAPALILDNHTVNFAFRRGLGALDIDYKEYCVSLLRGFPADGDFLTKFRFQVCTPLLANLAARMQTFDSKQFQEHIDNLKTGEEILLKGGIQVPGHKADIRSFWLFPIVVNDIPSCYKKLNEEGIDAYLGATQLRIVESPQGSKFESPEATREFFDRILYLPLHPKVPKSDIIKICNRTVEIINEVEKKYRQPKPKL